MPAADSPPRADGAGRRPGSEPDLDIFRLPLDWRRWWTILPEIVVLALVGLLPLVVGANVLSRYSDWYRILWAEDVVKVLFLWIVFLGGAVAVKYGAHVRMSTWSDRLAKTGRAGALWSRLIVLSPAVMGTVLLVLGIRIVEISMKRELPTLEISAGYFSTIVPLSGALMILYAVRALWARSGSGPGPLS
jgi:TRAP-type C4-dicarboxylate transport system permease small subunit